MSKDFEALTERLAELESQAAFQEELHQRLDDVVARQDQELLRLKEQLAALARRVAQLQEPGLSSSENGADEVPPHY